ncbi:hypothetical protein ACFYRC_30440 [Streptomyces sp. NPDC005279]|uniref:hypothetical protein n=1 Tax=Streptomyces sp. NPDC005279 TaxID=3364712 RepID=UPI0036B93D17
MSAVPRSRAQRRRDTEHRLTHGIGVWAASASAAGHTLDVSMIEAKSTSSRSARCRGSG